MSKLNMYLEKVYNETYPINQNKIVEKMSVKDIIAKINGLDHVTNLSSLIIKAQNKKDPYEFLVDKLLAHFKDPDDAENAADKIMNAMGK